MQPRLTVVYSDLTVSLIDAVNAKGDTPREVLKNLFTEFNSGSERESVVFRSIHCRSMSVGDFARVDGQWYRRDECGWKPVDDAFVARWMAEIRRRVGIDMKNDPRQAHWIAANNMMFELESSGCQPYWTLR